MKKIFFIWLFALVTIGAFSQNVAEHLSFMGIPINGTITQFQSKLQGKGCVLDKAISQSLSVGCRAFKGKFAGEKVDVYVYYNETTKNVYRVKAVVNGVSEDLVEQKYDKFKRMLQTKYGSDFNDYGTQADKESFRVLVASESLADDMDSSLSLSANGFKGEVDLFISEDDSPIRYPFCFNLHIDYIDAINNEKHQSQSLEDI